MIDDDLLNCQKLVILKPIPRKKNRCDQANEPVKYEQSVRRLEAAILIYCV